MKVAVITPFHQTRPDWLQQCLASVAQQTVPCTHFLVCDGDEPPAGATSPRRASDSLAAGSRRFRRAFPGPLALSRPSAWVLKPLLTSIPTIGTSQTTCSYCPPLTRPAGLSVCSCDRTLYDLEGYKLGPCPEVDGKSFVDTNCLFLTEKAFCMVAVWYLIPRSKVEIGDRLLWKAIKDTKVKRAHVNQRHGQLSHPPSPPLSAFRQKTAARRQTNQFGPTGRADVRLDAPEL